MSRVLPTKKGLLKFPYFNMPLVEMKGWQLYVGQSVWVITVGLIFFLVMKALEVTGAAAIPGVQASVKLTKKVATGEGVDSSFAPALLAP